MKFYSTKDRTKTVSLEYAVLRGLADDCGLFMPVNIPQLPKQFFSESRKMSFQEIAYRVAKNFFQSDLPDHLLQDIVSKAFNFDVVLAQLTDNIYVLELFHGPTLAFKDFAARFMSQLMSYFVRNSDKELTILVATSGDTGSAVAHGFYNIPGIKVIILYPSKKVSLLQEKQIATLDGNITVLEIRGTFDDCQRLVKQAFMDPDLQNKLWLTSANSINIARLIPQSFYYFYAFSKIEDSGKSVVFSVPSGNFGNLNGGILAKRMGLPVDKFVAATNANDVIPKYLSSGRFHPQPSRRTISNAMDVGNPSNWARILELFDNDLQKIRQEIFAVSVSEEQTRETMNHVFQQYSYIMDPHTAVGYLGLIKYLSETQNQTCGISLSTAHPAKFKDIVEKITGQSITLPERLATCLKKKNRSIVLSKEFAGFKEFLFETVR